MPYKNFKYDDMITNTKKIKSDTARTENKTVLKMNF